MTEHAPGAFPGAALCVGTVAAIVMIAPAPAAEPISPLAPGLLGVPARDEARAAERYATPDGKTRFLMDRTGRAVLVRFEGRREVLALTSTPGPRGDEFLKTDTGRVLMRVTALGGVIVFADAQSSGAPVAALGAARPLPPPAPPPGGLDAKLVEMERRTARALGRPVAFEVAAAKGPASGVVYDAAERAAEGLEEARAHTVRRVVIQVGTAPTARLERDSLRVTVVPSLGYAGRPSAEAVEAAVEAR